MRKNFGRTGKTTMGNSMLLSGEQLESRTLMTANPMDFGVKQLYQYHYRDNELSRNEMISILHSTRDNGSVDRVEFNDLKQIIETSNMPDYVKYFASSVVNGSPANKFFNGQPLGNLFAGASHTHMSSLINKWFLGKDHPTIHSWKNNTSYQYVAGGLFVNRPSINDIDQGALGDCYLINALGAVAHSSPTAIHNMFIYNGDNTWTVRFINHSNNNAHYVSVDRYLPVNRFNGQARFASFGGHFNNSNNELWVALAEKGYVQVSQIPGFRSNAKQIVNDYNNINGGFNSLAVHHIIGVRPTAMRLTNELSVIRNINTKQPMVIAIGNHAYTISSYNHQTRQFHIHNPWGHTHLELNWSEMSIRGLTNKVVYVVNARLTRPVF